MNVQATPVPVGLLLGPHLYECCVWVRKGRTQYYYLRARDKDAARELAARVIGCYADAVCARYVSSKRS